MTFVLGLTGSIGMGKSTTAAMFRARGIPVYDADQTVHDLYRGEAVPLIEADFPGSVIGGVVDRQRLSAMVLNNPDAMKKLEAIVHPLVRAAERRFLKAAVEKSASLVVLDIPLLLETNGHQRVDAILVVSAEASVQKSRVLARPEMTDDKFAVILNRQMPDSEKRRQAHYVIDTGSGFEAAAREVDTVIRIFRGRKGQAAAAAMNG
jgi:dephospho-CoA kinase